MLETVKNNGYVSVTPDMASAMLGASNGNRTISDATVNMYASDMTAGKWKKNGEPIIFSKSGVLRDGHHRLGAVVKSGTTQEMYIIWDVDDDVTLFDMGRSRTVRDIMVMSGTESWMTENFMISLVRAHYRIHGNMKPSYEMIHEFMDRNYDSLKFIYDNNGNGSARRDRKYGKRSPVGVACLYALVNGTERYVVSDFLYKLNSGIINGDDESSIVQLRKLLEEESDRGASYVVMIWNVCEQALRDFAEKKPRHKRYSITAKRVNNNDYSKL